MKILVLLVLFALGTWAHPARAAEPRVAGLRCEYLNDPIGIDQVHPRLSWTIEAGDPADRGIVQSAYRILVAETPEQLAADQGTLWDSGRVESDRSIQVSYAGKPLRSFQSCYWKVRIWGNQGRESAWSEPARWTMGVLFAEDWQPAEWITRVVPEEAAQKKLPPLDWKNVSWIWTPGDQSLDTVPAGLAAFRCKFEIPAGVKIASARLLVTADDQYHLFLNGQLAGQSDWQEDAWRRPRLLDVAEFLREGTNILAVDVWNQKVSPAGLAAKLVIQPVEGDPIEITSGESWLSIEGKQPDQWNTIGYDDAQWKPSRVWGSTGIQPWGELSTAAANAAAVPSPIFRKAFSLDKPIRRATVSIAALGYHELYLNGQKVGDHLLDPAFSRYDRRTYYVTHDVTGMLQSGENALGVMLGNGWYNMHTRAVWNFDQAPWRRNPQMLALLRIEYEDGSIEAIGSDASWRASTGPVVFDSIRNGEVYDARLESDWDRPGFDDSAWAAAEPVPPPGEQMKLSAQMMPPIRVTQKIRPVACNEVAPGVFVFDLGQNTAGFAEIRVRGPAGTKIHLRYGERIKPDGHLEQWSLNQHVKQGEFQSDTYILKGDENGETWHPRFVYHGFQYVEVTGWPGTPTVDDLTGCVIHTDFAPAGSFACSDELLNTIQRLTRWSYRSNFHGYPTDCPHREKNGWTGDAHLAAEQAMYNWHNEASYAKWIADLRDEQKPDGSLPGIVPTSGWGYAWGNGPAWDSSLVLILWYQYCYRGDVNILRDNREAIKRYVDYMDSRSKNHLVDFGLGDWVPAKTQTPTVVTSTGYFYLDTVLYANMAEILGDAEEAKRYRARAAEIARSFHETLYKGDGLYANGSQTALSCALHQGLVPNQEVADLTLQRLVEAVHAADDHLDTGILGAKYLFRSLSQGGRPEVALAIARQTTPPSYGDWIERGATTLWEDWGDGESRNHIMFGDISAWFYQTLAGIQVDPSQPGFKHTVFAPQVIGDLTHVEARTDSMYGPIVSEWTRQDDQVEFTVAVPPNTTATVVLPLDATKPMTEGGGPLEKAEGVKILSRDGGRVTLEIGSGEYRFAGSLAEGS